MYSLTTLLIILIVGLIVGGILAWIISSLKFKGNLSETVRSHPLVRELSESSVAKDQELNSTREEIKGLIEEIARIEQEYNSAKDTWSSKQKEINQVEEKFQKEFENLANRIFNEKSESFVKTNRDSLDILLNPLKEKIKSFEEKVEKTYSDTNRESIQLKTEIKSLLEMNKQLSSEANNLALALKGESKTQGNWGEQQLEVLLEKSGLKKGIHYETQITLNNEDGDMLRPDFLINLPEGKKLIIDSKVSLTAYERFFSAEDADSEQRELNQHLISIKNHIKGLSSKEYQKLYSINTPDYVIMFVPLDAALNLALENDHNLMNEALEKNVVLVTTSTLLATMKTVSYIWKQEEQRKNVQEIAKQGGALYDKFASFILDMKKIKKQLDGATNSYDEALKKLSEGRGNLVNRAENLRKLGIKNAKAIDQDIVDLASLDKETTANEDL